MQKKFANFIIYLFILLIDLSPSTTNNEKENRGYINLKRNTGPQLLISLLCNGIPRLNVEQKFKLIF